MKAIEKLELIESVLKGAKYKGVHFKDCRFNNVLMDNCEFKSCRFENCSFCKTSIYDCVFDACNINGTFSRVDIEACSIKCSSLREATFIHSNFCRCEIPAEWLPSLSDVWVVSCELK